MPIDGRFLRLLRTTRSDPPGLAAGDRSRARRYSAALEQFQQLLEASASLGVASRPLPLFYALEQGARAVAAVHMEVAGGALQGGHGLTMRGYQAPLGSAVVAPKGHGTYQGLCTSIESPALSEEAEVGALWASLPESFGVQLAGDHPYALPVTAEREPMMLTRKIKARVYGLPDNMADRSERAQVLAEILQHYPTSKGWRSCIDDGVAAWETPTSGWTARVEWELQESTGSDEARSEHLLTQIAPRSDERERGWLRPSVSGGRQTLDDLSTWFPVLFALSMFARYEPGRWGQLLNVDSSPEAVTIEELLEKAIGALPRLMFHAITRNRLYLPR